MGEAGLKGEGGAPGPHGMAGISGGQVNTEQQTKYNKPPTCLHATVCVSQGPVGVTGLKGGRGTQGATVRTLHTSLLCFDLWLLLLK